jgi:meiotic recombination protein SPO11
VVESDFWETLKLEGILITAKGYADIISREFLNFVCTPSKKNGYRSCPVFGLFDYDPDGIAILSTYKYGSDTLRHETDSIRCIAMQWIGLDSSHIRRAISMTSTNGLVALSKRDRRLAATMLNRAPFGDFGEEPGWRQALQTMLMLNLKAEIQFLETYEGGLGGWLTAQSITDFQGNFRP